MGHCNHSWCNHVTSKHLFLSHTIAFLLSFTTFSFLARPAWKLGLSVFLLALTLL